MRQIVARLAIVVLVLGAGLPLSAQTPPGQDRAASPSAGTDAPGDGPVPEARFLINLRDATLATLAEQVSEITGRTLVLDPTVTGTVTVIAAQPLDRDAVWDLFQSVLASNGYAALQSGAFWRVVPQGVVREGGGVVEDPAAQGRLDIITRLIPLQNVPVATAANALRPLVASFGYIEAIPESNTLIVTDMSENVRRLEALARTLDGDSEVRVYSLPLRNAVARDVAAALQAILPDAASGAPPGLSVDDRANVILLRGTAETFAEAERLVADLDVPGRPGPSVVPVTRVYPLRFAEAASLAEILSNLVSGGAASATNAVAAALPPVPGVGGAAAADAPPGDPAAPPPVLSLASEDISIQPDLAGNAIVVRAREEVQADLAALIAQLDTRRPQVLIEAAIVEISGDVSEQLGVQLGLGSAAPPGGFAATSFPGSGPSLDGVLRLLGSPVSAAVAPAGVSIGLARGDRFGLLIQALGQSNKARLLSTPSLTTLDNQSAEIVVGQNVPFRTGSFDRGSGGETAFTTIERRDVGITMRVTPRVTDGGTIQLQISQEVSSLVAANVAGAADLVTNRRSIETTVLSDNGGTIVLGGLITNDRQSGRSEVPGLGRVPVVGALFRSRQESQRRQTLFVFMRATVLSDGFAAAEVTSDRVQRLRAVQASDTPQSLLAPPRPAQRQPVEIDGLY